MNKQTKNNQIVEIDMKNVLWELLSQWKAVLIISLALAILLAGAKYFKDRASYDDAIIAQKEAEEQQASLSQDERIAIVINSLQMADQNKVRILTNEKKWIKKQNSYLKNSILMQTDPTNQRELSLVFRINAEKKEDLPVLLQSYEAIARSETIVEAIKPAISPDSDNKYISELIRNNDNAEHNETISEAGAAITVKIIIPEETDCERVAEAASAAMVNQGKSLVAEFPHSLVMAKYDVARIYNSEMIEDRQATFLNIYKMETDIKNAESSLSAEQKAALEAIAAIVEEESNIDDPEEQIADSAKNKKSTLVAPGFSKKYALLGFVMGVLLYSLCYVAFSILKGCISAASVIEDYTGARLLGEAYYKGERKGLSVLLHSDLIDKIRYKKMPDFAAQFDKIEKSLEAVCAHADAKEATMISLTDTNANELVRTTIREMSKQMSNRGTKLDEVTIASDFDESELLPIKKAVLLVGNDTKEKKLKKLIELCHDYDISLLGSIYISEM